MPRTKNLSKVPNYAIDSDILNIIKFRKMLANRIPQSIQQIRYMSQELQQMAQLADMIDMEAPRIALNEIEDQKG